MTGIVAYPKLHVPAGEDFLLLSPTAQAHAYRNVDRMFATAEAWRFCNWNVARRFRPAIKPGKAYMALTRTWIAPTWLGCLSSSRNG